MWLTNRLNGDTLTTTKEMGVISMLNADRCHKEIVAKMKPALAYDESKDFDTWREQVREKLMQLLGDMPQERCDLNVRVEWEKEHDTFYEKRIIFTSEENMDIPCHLWVPKTAKLPCPVAICLQGHTTGMHISMGRTIYPPDAEYIQGGDRDLAVQAIRNGYAALSLELRGFGELKSPATLDVFPEAECTCEYPAMTAALVGRTLIGERTWDISRAIDMLETMPEIINTKKILLTGNSGGGTATYYAACLDERITVAAPSCSVCSFENSIVWKRHCSCNYIPTMIKYFDMGELACLIAPRPLVIIAGVQDWGFDIAGSRKVAAVAQKIYDKVGVSDKFRFIEGPEGHRYYADLTWPVIHELFD